MSGERSGADLARRMTAVVPGGVDSNVRLEVADLFIESGSGARIRDVDGREYIDHVLGQGPAFLGHAHPAVLAAVRDAIGTGMTFAAQTRVELRAAELLVNTLGWAEQVRIGMTSTETVQAALRVARAHTGRRRFLRFRGQYHGWLDNTLMDWTVDPARLASEGQDPDAAGQGITVPWNDLAAAEAALAAHPGEIAAIITEPMMCNAGAIPPLPGYLAGLRSLCDAHGALLILDETITGFRLALGGGAERFGVRPDLAIYGKAVAGGYPASVLAGPAAIMGRFAAGTNHSGTFNANVLSCAAIVAALEVMRDEPVHARVEATGAALMDGIRALAGELGVPLQVRGLPPAFHVSFDTPDPVVSYADLLRADSARYRRLVRHAREAGLYLAGRGIWYVSAAHDVETTRTALDRLGTAIRMLLRDDPAAAPVTR